MLLSMTGYGKGVSTQGDMKLKVEIKSLNGKLTDIRMKVPPRYRDKEIEIRKYVTEGAKRGKLEVSFSLVGTTGDEEFDLNQPLFNKYLGELKSIRDAQGIEQSDLISAVLRFPNVIQSQDSEVDDDEWRIVLGCVDEALQGLRAFRMQEGSAMESAIVSHINTIQAKLKEVEPFEKARIDGIKSRLTRGLQNHMNGEQVDENRFEQEILFYLEKLDITEEKVRLAQHCEYFLEVINNQDEEKGKKLGFIAQEIGREINTMGAKAQSSDIQRCVVGMKDELEKIKEMLANTI